MSRPDEPADELTAAERRLLALLLILRGDPPRADPALTATVMRTARIQQALHGAVHAVASLAGAVVDGIALVLGLRRSNGGRA